MDDLSILVERLRNVMRDYVTNYEISKQPAENARLKKLYTDLRLELMDSEIAPLLPRSVKTHDTLASFDQTMKNLGGYADRREFIKKEFEPILAKLEGQYASVVDIPTVEALEKLGLEHIQESWERALSRIHDEPDAAITSARTMLESLYKSLLDEFQIEYGDDLDLQKLHRLVAEQLDFVPEQQAAQSLRVLTGNIQSIVSQLGALRNKISDAHGQGQEYYRPTPEIAEFIVNLAGSLAILIVRLSQNSKGGAD